MSIRVIVVDDSKIDRLRLIQLLKHFENIQLIAEESKPEVAINTILRTKPDLAFLDIEMPNLSGFDIVDAINKEGVFPTIVFVTAYEQYAIKAIRNRAFDYLLKPLDIGELQKTLIRYEKDQLNIHGQLDCTIIDTLTLRENEVLKHLVMGKTSKEISKELCISINTVNSHRANLLKKTKSKNIAELILWSAKCNFE